MVDSLMFVQQLKVKEANGDDHAASIAQNLPRGIGADIDACVPFCHAMSLYPHV